MVTAVEVVSLLLKVVKSAADKKPGTEAVEVARVNVHVLVDEVMESPVMPLVASVMDACFALKVVKSAAERKPD